MNVFKKNFTDSPFKKRRVFRDTPHEGLQQVWYQMKDDNLSSCYKLVNLGTLQCLVSDFDGKVYTDKCKEGWDGLLQYWKYENSKLINCITHGCLDGNVYGLFALPCSPNFNQWWALLELNK
jgi:hypothetical protein